MIHLGTDADDLFVASGNDTYDGLAGNDTLDYSLATSDITARLDQDRISGAGYNNILISIESLIATGFDDVVYGGAADNILDVRAGGDTVYGGDGDDLIYGGLGDDILRGDEGRDQIHDGEGQDTVYGGLGDDVLFDGLGNDNLLGSDGDDRFVSGAGLNSFNGGNGLDAADYSGLQTAVTANLAQRKAAVAGATDTFLSIEVILGSVANDLITGDNLANQLFGNLGDDSLVGGGSSDLLSGGQGNDKLNGGTGDDRIDGGVGVDKLTGAKGLDQFVFRAGDSGSSTGQRDTITDFKIGEDKIDLRQIVGAQVSFAHVSAGLDRILIDTDQDGLYEMQVDVKVGSSGVLLSLADVLLI